MTTKFIAIAPKGREYIYKRSSMLAVPKKSAQVIADALTKERYRIKDGEVWHVYDTEYGDEDFISGNVRNLGKGRLRITHSGRW